MTAFEFAFTLFGLVLGLAMAEVLAGFARVLRARTPVAGSDVPIRIGWFTPLIGLVVALDLVTSWNLAWHTLSGIEINVATLAFGLFETGLYFFAATLVWPDDPMGWPDLDRWFDRHKAQIGGAIALANVGFAVIYVMRDPDHYSSPWLLVLQVSYIAAAASLIVSRKPWQSALAVGYLLAMLGYVLLSAIV